MASVQVFDPAATPFVEELFARFREDSASVSAEWRAYFLGLQAAQVVAGEPTAATPVMVAGDGGLDGYARAWRERGHLVAKINPLQEGERELPAELQPARYGLAEGEGSVFPASYGGAAGIEVAAVREPAERVWVQQWWEGEGRQVLPLDLRRKMYEGLVQATLHEQFLHRKFVGAKRFSIEGLDILVPLLQRLADMASDAGLDQLVMGMAHRGRLNVLCNVFHKPFAELVAGFADKLDIGPGVSGDVKYHMGKTYVHHAESGREILLQLLFNPSHLEAVNPVVLGVARARKDAGLKVLPVLVHGDSAVSGQGVVAETNNMMGVAAHDVGGVVHLVMNNQVGFTADERDASGGPYCTEIFKPLGVPIVHVNADNMEACWQALCFAFAYRATFGKDVVVDLVGYRRWGHNEGDDPTFTQPLMYEKIREHQPLMKLVAAELAAAGVDSGALAAVEKEVLAKLEAAFAEGMQGKKVQLGAALGGAAKEPVTTCNGAQAVAVTDAWRAVPEGFTVHDRVAKVLDERVAMMKGDKPLNWGAAETAAYGALLQEGVGVRLNGQDSRRGTFSHRHAVLTCAKTGAMWNPLAALAAKGAAFEVYNSPVSENACLGFEYGYALGKTRRGLVIWEAQFGDFANGAQVVIDQFMAAGGAKWGQPNGLTLLLPHGYEGQGPEHSSARLERFLQLCAEENIRVAVPSTPAQMFHLLRRQALLEQQRPLVVMTPKSLLRNPQAVSPLGELVSGSWQKVIGEDVPPLARGKKPPRVVLCSGKIFYDLLARREAEKNTDIVLVRIEQLYPFPADELAAMLVVLRARDVVWAQEEPRNMGAWEFIRSRWQNEWGYLHYAGRAEAASPACGSGVRHLEEFNAIMEEVFK